jgi:hypothetical protein
MQKLKLKSIYKFCNSCSSSHTEHNKIGFAFFGLFKILYGFYKLQSTHKRVKNHFAHRPLERLKWSQLCPSFAQKALELHGTLQCSPWAKGGGEAGGGDGREKVGEESRGCRDSI